MYVGHAYRASKYILTMILWSSETETSDVKSKQQENRILDSLRAVFTTC